MGRASAADSTSGSDAPARRRRRGIRLRLRRRRSSTPASVDATSQDLTPWSTAASFTQQPSSLPYHHAIASYAIVVPLPIFRGDPGECPDAHLDRLDCVCLANGDATSAAAAHIFPASLDADAALWYKLTVAGDEASPPPPWDAVRAAFVDFFRPPGAADRARAELMALRQRPGETVNRYQLRMQGILRRFPDRGADVPDAFLLAAFVDGLRAEFKEWVVPQHPEVLEDAVALAVSWERAASVRKARRAAKEACSAAAAERCAFCGTDGHEEARCEVRRGMRELWRRSNSSVSAGATAANDGEEAEEGGGSMTLARLGSALSTRSTQCQCRKHRCWKRAVAASEVAAGDEGNGAAADK